MEIVRRTPAISSELDSLPAIPEYVIDREQKPVYLDSNVWRLNQGSNVRVIDWARFPVKNDLVVWATQFYLSHLIQTRSAAHVSGTFENILTLRDTYDGALDELNGAELEDSLPLALNSQLSYLRKERREHVFARVRKWYVWCAEMELPGFSMDAAYELEELVIRGNRKGEAVSSGHVTKGAYQPIELAVVLKALRDNKWNDELLDGIVLIWLCMALGANTSNFALLREEDFFVKANPEHPENRLYFLRVPRIKKRNLVPRQEFMERRLNPEVGEVVERLIHMNRKKYPKLEKWYARPIFFSKAPRQAMPQEYIEYARHLDTNALRAMMVETMAKLNILSPVTGQPLVANPRRFRRTFCSVAAANGMPMRVLANWMDHSDLQQLPVYYQQSDEFIKKLNVTYAEKLAPMVQFFLGEIEELPKETILSDKLIFGLPSMVKITAIGHCSSDHVCNLMPPRSCYVCSKFRAFKDADHRGCLNAMVEEREMRYKGAIGVDAQLDEAVLACASVTQRIEALWGVR